MSIVKKASENRRFVHAMRLFGILTLLFLIHCQTSDKRFSPYLILYAFDAEGVLLSQQMTITDSVTTLGRTAYIGQLSGKDIVLAESGVGMTNAAMSAQYLIDQFHPIAVIFSGIAGAIDTSVHIGDIVVCSDWITHDYGYYGKEGFRPSAIQYYDNSAGSLTTSRYFAVDSVLLNAARQVTGDDLALDKIGKRIPSLLVGGTGVSGNSFVDSQEKRLWLNRQFSAMVTDMESAAVAQVCVVNGLPFIIFRSASDLAGGSGSETAREEMGQFYKIAAGNSSTLVMKLLRSL
jgi:adenosylhomocysteine nucleosidase